MHSENCQRVSSRFQLDSLSRRFFFHQILVVCWYALSLNQAVDKDELHILSNTVTTAVVAHLNSSQFGSSASSWYGLKKLTWKTECILSKPQEELRSEQMRGDATYNIRNGIKFWSSSYPNNLRLCEMCTRI